MSEIRRLREERNLSRDELAAKSGVSSLTIRAHELGTVNGTETKTAEAVAAALGVPVQALFFPVDLDKPKKDGENQERVPA
ncbi:helix-turn-helix transcriptional regulator [Deinococcus sp. YIM 77859]|uniref:helix-turn-helix transcriptional regulator n=1 Tax=Deinococcus sp. YIM 77859 TaxID=1540221 RepID=UPI0005542015|nr:helix-turn-helix transcriptional regulator [Deinococcus sp. YIM 77859]